MFKLFKRLFCEHQYIYVEDAFRLYMGTDYISKVCAKCGKRVL